MRVDNPGVPGAARAYRGAARPAQAVEEINRRAPAWDQFEPVFEAGYRLVPIGSDRPWAYRVAGPYRLVWGFTATA